MTTALTVVVVGVIILALTVDVAALVGLIRRYLER
jgi:hypothetical protein